MGGAATGAVRAGRTRPDRLVAGAVVALGAVHLTDPFFGDQGLFRLGAQQLAKGAVLYRDFWDLKQPGIYLFYLAAGRGFGFGEIGIHLFELVVLVGFALWLRRLVAPRLVDGRVAAAVPLLTVGFYYAVARPTELTQVEALVGVPLFGALWLALGTEPSARRLVAAGLCGGVALVFKLLFAPLLLAVWAAVLAPGYRPRRWVPRLAVLAAGAAVPVAAAALWLTWAGAGTAMLRTWFVFPLRVGSVPGTRSWSDAGVEARLFLVSFAPLLVAAAVGVRGRDWRDPLRRALVAWVLVGLVLVFVQFSWNTYLHLLLLVPLGLLAAEGLDVLLERRRAGDARPAALVLTALVPLCLPAAGHLARSVSETARYLSAVATGRADPRDDYAATAAEAHELRRPCAVSGRIVVFGDPAVFRFAHRGPAIAVNGWVPEIYLPETWREVTRELARARPPYVLLPPDAAELMQRRGPATWRFLQDGYVVVRSYEDENAWYQRRDLASTPDCRPPRDLAGGRPPG